MLVPLAEIPPKNKVLRNVMHTWSNHTHRDIMPRRSPIPGLAQLIALPILHSLKVHDSIVIKILAQENLILHSCLMHIRQRMLLIQAPKMQIEAPIYVVAARTSRYTTT